MKLTALTTAAALLFTSLVLAADAKKDEKVMHLPLKGTVVAVTPRTVTLNGAEGKEDRKFNTNKDTEVEKGRIRATVADIKPGMEVTGSFVRQGGTDTITKLQLKPGNEKK